MIHLKMFQNTSVKNGLRREENKKKDLGMRVWPRHMKRR